jgi:hypothetical protein
MGTSQNGKTSDILPVAGKIAEKLERFQIMRI